MKQNEHGQDNGKRKIRMTAGRVEEFIARLDDMPSVLADKAIRPLFLSILILFIGLSYGIQMKDDACIMMSVLLFLALLSYGGWLFYVAFTKAYETVEGTIIDIQKRPGFTGKRKVEIRMADRSRKSFLLEQNCVLQPEQAYRFYIAKRAPDEIISIEDTGGIWIRSPDAVYGFERIVTGNRSC